MATPETLPPGQRPVEGFPRFGTHLSRPAPVVPVDPVIELRGPGLSAATDPPSRPVTVAVADLATLPRRRLTADLHCVAGWSALGLRWEGVAFAELYGRLIEPRLPPGTVVTHVTFRGLDGFRAVVTIGDALGPDVLLADRLDGEPLDRDHGAPVRLVSPDQYGYVNIKHLDRIEVHTAEPTRTYRSLLDGHPMRLLAPHPRARVWEEERHRVLPSWSLRGVYRATIAPTVALSAMGGPRVPVEDHLARPWRIHEIAPDLAVEDVWALPVHGGPDDLERFVRQFLSGDPTDDLGSGPAQALWWLRDRVGGLLGLGRVSTPDASAEPAAPTSGSAAPDPVSETGTGTGATSLAARLPADLRGTADDVDVPHLPFVPLYRTATEFAAELSNPTVHAVLHLGWIDDGDDRWRAQMAVLVKPQGVLGSAYLALIKPFRHAVVYPALLRSLERRWAATTPVAAP